MKLSRAQQLAIAIAMKSNGGYVYIGRNPGWNTAVGANTVRSLVQLGLMKYAPHQSAQLTAAGIEAGRANTKEST